MDPQLPSAKEADHLVSWRSIMRRIDTNQTRVIERLREVHLIALKEIERLNLRISELECQSPAD